MFKRTYGHAFISLSFLGIAACGAATTTPTATQPTAVEQTKNDAPVVAVAADAPTQAEKAEDALPKNVTSLFQFVGKDAPIVINVPRPDKVIAALDPETQATIEKELLEKINAKSPVEAVILKRLWAAFDGAVIFVDPAKKKNDAKNAKDDACIAAKFNNPGMFELLLSAKTIERDGARFTAWGNKEKTDSPLHGVWLEDSAHVVACAKPEALARTLDVAKGEIPSYITSSRFVAEREHDVFVSFDMHPIVGDSVEPGSDLFASLTTTGQSLGLDLRLNLYGPKFPPVGSVLAPASQALVGQMPKGTIGAIGISLKRAPGKDLTSVITLIDKATDGHNLKEIQDGLANVGIQLGDVDLALGDDLALGVYRNSKEKIDFEKSEGMKHTAVVFSLATKDESAHNKIWSAIVTVAKKKNSKGVTIQGNVIESGEDPKAKKKEFARVESRKGVVVFAVGDKSVVKEALRKFGKETLASTPIFQDARAKEKPAVHVLGFLDGATLKSLVTPKTEKSPAPNGENPAFLSLLLGPTDRGLELALGGGGAMDLIGTSGRLAANAFKAYIADSKTSEPRMNVRFLASHAKRAYERETADGKGQRHTFCKSALPVPAAIPKGTTYKTSMGAGGDWDTGDDNSGWKCLDYFSNEEIRYQYEYRQGGNYKGPKRGGPNPGPNGFEVSAEGDLDGDGKTSLFTRTGKVVGGKVVLDDDVFSSDPNE